MKAKNLSKNTFKKKDYNDIIHTELSSGIIRYASSQGKRRIYPRDHWWTRYSRCVISIFPSWDSLLSSQTWRVTPGSPASIISVFVRHFPVKLARNTSFPDTLRQTQFRSIVLVLSLMFAWLRSYFQSTVGGIVLDLLFNLKFSSFCKCLCKKYSCKWEFWLLQLSLVNIVTYCGQPCCCFIL